MKLLKSILLAGSGSMALLSVVHAADLPTKKGAPAAIPVLASCTNVQDFFTTACPLTYYGVTFYGTVDVGGGYQTEGAPLNRNIISGVEELIQKNSHQAQYTLIPNGLSQSNVGVKVAEHLFGDLSFVGQAEFGFDPYTLSLANGPASNHDNTNLPLAAQSSVGDSSRAGQWDNSQGFFGLSSKAYGALTWGRQNSLTLDGINAYDPMGLSYAYSVIGYSGATGGFGDTEDARSNTAAKYRLTIPAGSTAVRFGALAQTGGFEQGNGANAEYQGQIGADFYGFSFDAIYSYAKDAVSMGAYNGAPPAGVPLGAVKVTLSDDSSVMLLAKYTWNQFKFYGGFENIEFQNPSDSYGATAAKNGGPITTLGGFDGYVQKFAYSNPKTLQVYWGGLKYAITPDLDVTGAYYHYHQLNFSTASCAHTFTSAAAANCDGTLDAVSGMLDWRFAKKFDVYAGVMFSEVNNALASGYLHHTTADPSAGLRFRF